MILCWLKLLVNLKVLFCVPLLFICGDFNVDFNHTSFRHSVLLAFMHSGNLVSMDCNFPIDYTYHRDDNLAQSWPDHILTYPHHSTGAAAAVKKWRGLSNIHDLTARTNFQTC